MPSLLERLRQALAPRYEVQGEVASGGMATVFRALDTSLDRVVAIKVLRPEMATATGEARFLREARTLASFSHPNVVPIHDADQRAGLSYYVMDLVEGETLARRLERGPLGGRDAFRLGRDLLAALERLHAAGIVHRDVKPSNIFLTDGRAMLADFGIVHVQEPGDDSLTSDGWGPGTPAYMSPEQAKGGKVTAASDLYSAAMVVYEALSGRRWSAGEPPDAGDWRKIPLAARPALRRALALDPEGRPATAAQFMASLRTRGPGIRVPRWAAALAVLALAATAIWATMRTSGPASMRGAGRSDVAVFPCAATRPSDARLAEEVGWRVALNLEDVPGITTASRQAAFSLYERRGGTLVPSDWTHSLRASHALRCLVETVAGGLMVDMRLLNGQGEAIAIESFEILADSEAERFRRVAVAISMEVIGSLVPAVTVTEEEVDRFAAYSIETLRPFFWGDHYLRRGAWRSAERRYQEALSEDSTFTLARMRLAEVQRWLADRPIGEDLQALRHMDLSSLSPLDSLLLDASARPHGPDQLAAYEAILAQPEYQRDPYATLLYADELYHRGGLWGVPLDSAIQLLRRAVRQDSSLVPAVEHLTQALIRTERKAEAEAVLEHLWRIHPGREEAEIFYPEVWSHGFREKFDPDAAREFRGALADLPLAVLALYARWVRYIESPSTQAALGALLVRAADREGDAQLAAQGFVNRGLGLIALDRIDEGVAAFDSAARRFETPETAAQAAEWRAILGALDEGDLSAPRAEEGDRVLEALWERRDTGVPVRQRAAIGLALLAHGRGDDEARLEWARRLDSLTSGDEFDAGRPSRLLTALAAASGGDYREALDRTAADLAYDSIGLAGRPFLRSMLYLKRGDWYLELGMPDSAIASWRWHENTDLEGTVPPHLVQAAEVDGALGPLARRRVGPVMAGNPR